jgi:hypothetical protein
MARPDERMDEMDIVDLLRRDHARIRSLLVRTATGSVDQRWATFSQTSELIIRHEVGEEMVVYPELLDLPGGATVSGSRLDDQAAIETLLVALDREEFESPGFQRDAVRMGSAVLGHLENEDSQILPLLAASLEPLRRVALGRRFLEVVRVAPVRRTVAAGVPTGPAIVDRTSAVSIFMRDTAALGGMAS